MDSSHKRPQDTSFANQGAQQSTTTVLNSGYMLQRPTELFLNDTGEFPDWPLANIRMNFNDHMFAFGRLFLCSVKSSSWEHLFEGLSFAQHLDLALYGANSTTAPAKLAMAFGERKFAYAVAEHVNGFVIPFNNDWLTTETPLDGTMFFGCRQQLRRAILTDRFGSTASDCRGIFAGLTPWSTHEHANKELLVKLNGGSISMDQIASSRSDDPAVHKSAVATGGKPLGVTRTNFSGVTLAREIKPQYNSATNAILIDATAELAQHKGVVEALTPNMKVRTPGKKKRQQQSGDSDSTDTTTATTITTDNDDGAQDFLIPLSPILREPSLVNDVTTKSLDKLANLADEVYIVDQLLGAAASAKRARKADGDLFVETSEVEDYEVVSAKREAEIRARIRSEENTLSQAAAMSFALMDKSFGEFLVDDCGPPMGLDLCWQPPELAQGLFEAALEIKEGENDLFRIGASVPEAAAEVFACCGASHDMVMKVLRARPGSLLDFVRLKQGQRFSPVVSTIVIDKEVISSIRRSGDDVDQFVAAADFYLKMMVEADGEMPPMIQTRCGKGFLWAATQFGIPCRAASEHLHRNSV